MASLAEESLPASSDTSDKTARYDYNLWAQKATMPLEEMAFQLFEKLGVLETRDPGLHLLGSTVCGSADVSPFEDPTASDCRIPVSALKRVIAATQSGYDDGTKIPYHNVFHGFDVGQATLALLYDSPDFTDLEKFTLVFAGLVHDLGHPGRTSAYLAQIHDPIAIKYGAEGDPRADGCLEKYHVENTKSLVWWNAAHWDGGILAFFSRTAEQRLWDVAENVILATDMSLHFKLVSEFKARIDAGAYDVPEQTAEDRMLLLKIILKCADISNVCRIWPVAEAWTKRVSDEFLEQGDDLRSRGLEVEAMYDREQFKTPAHGVLGFIEFMAKPLWDALAKVLPAAVPFVAQLEANIKMFKHRKQEWEDQQPGQSAKQQAE